MFKKLGLRHAFFRPFLRRAGTIGVICIWAGLELWSGNTGWTILAAALAGLCALEFFVFFDPKNYGGDDG